MFPVQIHIVFYKEQNFSLFWSQTIPLSYKFLARENNPSYGTEVGGAHKYFWAIGAKLGNLEKFFDHH